MEAARARSMELFRALSSAAFTAFCVLGLGPAAHALDIPGWVSIVVTDTLATQVVDGSSRVNDPSLRTAYAYVVIDADSVGFFTLPYSLEVDSGTRVYPPRFIRTGHLPVHGGGTAIGFWRLESDSRIEATIRLLPNADSMTPLRSRDDAPIWIGRLSGASVNTDTATRIDFPLWRSRGGGRTPSIEVPTQIREWLSRHPDLFVARAIVARTGQEQTLVTFNQAGDEQAAMSVPNRGTAHPACVDTVVIERFANQPIEYFTAGALKPLPGTAGKQILFFGDGSCRAILARGSRPSIFIDGDSLRSLPFVVDDLGKVRPDLWMFVGREVGSAPRSRRSVLVGAMTRFGVVLWHDVIAEESYGGDSIIDSTGVVLRYSPPNGGAMLATIGSERSIRRMQIDDGSRDRSYLCGADPSHIAVAIRPELVLLDRRTLEELDRFVFDGREIGRLGGTIRTVDFHDAGFLALVTYHKNDRRPTGTSPSHAIVDVTLDGTATRELAYWPGWERWLQDDDTPSGIPDITTAADGSTRVSYRGYGVAIFAPSLLR